MDSSAKIWSSSPLDKKSRTSEKELNEYDYGFDLIHDWMLNVAVVLYVSVRIEESIEFAVAVDNDNNDEDDYGSCDD